MVCLNFLLLYKLKCERILFIRGLGEIMSLYNAHWPFILALQQTAPVNELLNPDVQLEEDVLKWNQDFLSVFLSLFTWLTLESPDRGCITFINSRKRPYRSPKSQTLKKDRNIKDALFIWKSFWCALGMNVRWRVHEMWRSEVSVLFIVVVGQLVPGPQMAWHRHRVPLGTGFTYCTVQCIML